ncbi:MAG: hypothetical protein KDA22_13915 [Phycisphaerales bacterium]|nr:hypothetical protein [Phycisphaerales bacterium]
MPSAPANRDSSRIPNRIQRAIPLRSGLAATMLALGVASAMSGCYSRVVKTDGVTPGVTEVYEPNLPDEKPRKTGGLTWSKSVTGGSKPTTTPPIDE